MNRGADKAQNRVFLENYSPPGELNLRIGELAEYYSHERYQESLNNLIPADV